MIINESTFEQYPDSIKNDPHMIKLILIGNPNLYKYINSEFQEMMEFAIISYLNEPLCWELFSDNIKNQFIEELEYNNIIDLSIFHTNIMNVYGHDAIVAHVLVNKNIQMTHHLNDNLKTDIEFAKLSIGTSDHILSDDDRHIRLIKFMEYSVLHSDKEFIINNIESFIVDIAKFEYTYMERFVKCLNEDIFEKRSVVYRTCRYEPFIYEVAKQNIIKNCDIMMIIIDTLMSKGLLKITGLAHKFKEQNGFALFVPKFNTEQYSESETIMFIQRYLLCTPEITICAIKSHPILYKGNCCKYKYNDSVIRSLFDPNGNIQLLCNSRKGKKTV